MKVVILCGGFGTRLKEETVVKPKPMVEIGGKPILWHIMKTYGHYGYKDFVLCLGYKSEVIKEYFMNYSLYANDFTIDLKTKNIQLQSDQNGLDWNVTLANTGANAMTGARVKRIEKYVDSDLFMLTYGDGVTNIDINELVNFHKEHDKIGTVSGVHPPSQYGELTIQNDQVMTFAEKKKNWSSCINGGYFVFKREFFNYLETDDQCVLERGPLERLAADGELKVFHHSGFWQCMDTNRDYKYLNGLWDAGEVPWKVW